MNAVDKFYIGFLIVWALLGIAMFFRRRRRSKNTISPQSLWFTWGTGGIITFMHLAADHAHDHAWLIGVEIGLPFIWGAIFIGKAWRESNIERDKAIAEGRIRAVYNDWAKPDPE